LDSSNSGFGHRSGLAAKADATRWQRCTPEMPSFRRRDPANSDAAMAFSSEVDPARVNKTRQIKNPERRFDSIETGKALGMIQQVKVRQQVHGEIAAKRSVAVAAVTTDSGNLDRALIEHDIVALISLGC
jgi:hypothetical protein